MKTFTFLTVFAWTLFSIVAADLKAAASLYPQCGACICTNKELAAIITTCVAANCTIKEQLATKNASLTACDAPIRDRRDLIIGFGAGGGAAALIVYFVRIYAKFTVPAAELGYDDLCISIAMSLAKVLMSAIVAKHGFGTDLWTIPPDSITSILKIYFADELMYITVISLTKVTILCFYLRVFPERKFRIWVFCTMGATILYMLAFLIVSAFQCWPLSYAWTHWDGEHHGRCQNVNAQGWAAAVINIVIDIVILVLPLKLITKLNLHWKKKLQISIMLSVGGFVTIVSILRLETLYQFAKSSNVSWDGVAFGYWSCIEMDVGIICACMPALYSLFKHLAPRAFGGTMNSKSSGNFGKGIVSAGSGITAAETPADRRAQDTKDFLPLVDIENVRDNRPGIAL
ncbi:uncharacterized protein A1O9_10800 [Exophiala aquamarina CBS 119918]|uniref:Uncharacterized protein n=1 Tax=Exophiala aquamarina CBS 119918 TaxID=1182545 RepID=A0A072PBG0_9EURO|nr:uncharacterized protein A1O9_10800 [Exophiala aquamarina CBS 119918]KEF52895.1 hypothetical protein A1O9_10800 [Exophiala aquamarina CBS 119918]